MTRTSLCVATLAATLIAVPSASAATVPVDLSTHFDRDVIVQHDGTSADSGNQSADAQHYAIATENLADAVSPGCTVGVPDDGVFPANGPRPAIDLAWELRETNNARQLATGDLAFEAEVDDGHYSRLDVFAVTGSGYSDLTVTLHYVGEPDQVIEGGRVNDWFDQASSNENAYPLVTGFARVAVGSGVCEDSGGGGRLWGLRFTPDANKVLDSITFTATIAGVDGEGDAVLNIFGAQLEEAMRLTVAKTGAGSGTVTSSPAGVSCGVACAQYFPAGTEVTLVATPSSGSRLASWGDACAGSNGNACTLTLSQERAATVTFEPVRQQQQQGPPPPGETPKGPPLPGDEPPKGPPPPPPPLPETVRFAQLATVPAPRSCARRRMTLKLRRIAGTTVSQATFAVGDELRTITGAALAKPIVLRALPRKAFTLKVDVLTVDGRTLKAERKFRRCPVKKRATRRRGS